MFTVTVSDGDVPLVTQTYTVNVTGADDAPTLAPVTSGSIAEDRSDLEHERQRPDRHAGRRADVDVETLTYGIQGGTVAAGVRAWPATYGTLTVNTAHRRLQLHQERRGDRSAR